MRSHRQKSSATAEGAERNLGGCLKRRAGNGMGNETAGYRLAQVSRSQTSMHANACWHMKMHACTQSVMHASVHAQKCMLAHEDACPHTIGDACKGPCMDMHAGT
eukprot:296394-Pelagomonas_calceolata.AAC.1